MLPKHAFEFQEFEGVEIAPGVKFLENSDEVVHRFMLDKNTMTVDDTLRNKVFSLVKMFSTKHKMHLYSIRVAVKVKEKNRVCFCYRGMDQSQLFMGDCAVGRTLFESYIDDVLKPIMDSDEHEVLNIDHLTLVVYKVGFVPAFVR